MEKVFDAHKIWSYVIVATLSFMEPLWVLILWFLIFVALDTITGVSASIKERKIITSNQLRKTIQKLMMYSMTIVLCHAIDVYMLTFIEVGLARLTSTIICGIELYSILENCYRITGNRIFKILTQFTLKKIEDHTGVNIDEKEKK